MKYFTTLLATVAATSSAVSIAELLDDNITADYIGFEGELAQTSCTISPWCKFGTEDHGTNQTDGDVGD